MNAIILNAPSNLSKKILTGPLRLVTICCDDIDEIQSFYRDDLTLEIEGPIDISQKEKVKDYLGIPEGIDFALYKVGPGHEDDMIHFRIINISQSTVNIKSTLNAREVGLLRMKRLVTNALEEKYQSPEQYHWVNKLCDVEQKDPDGATKTIREMCLTFVTDQIEEDLAMHQYILGMDVLLDETKKIEKKALPGLKEATVIRSIIMRSKMGKGCLIELIAYEDGEYIEPNAAPRLPNQGVAMCSFETADIGEVLARAHAKQIKVYRTPRKITDPLLGEVIVMSLLSPTGFIVEVFSRL